MKKKIPKNADTNADISRKKVHFGLLMLLATLTTLGLTGCATHRAALPRFEPPLPKREFQTVRTTAYTCTESDHRIYRNHNALGTCLKVGKRCSRNRLNSAAADWARWPAGTVFMVMPTKMLYCVDDYGWALSGRNTIDLYMPSTRAMNQWGVRMVPIRVLRWGNRAYSYHLLRSRAGKYRHLRRMVLEMEGRNRQAAKLK